jgi:hypothetical protein
VQITKDIDISVLKIMVLMDAIAEPCSSERNVSCFKCSSEKQDFDFQGKWIIDVLFSIYSEIYVGEASPGKYFAKVGGGHQGQIWTLCVCVCVRTQK